MQFPSIRPPQSNYIRPLNDEKLTLSPPGFSWWRAADRGTCQYRVIVTRDGNPYYESPLLSDPIYHPDRAFAPGTYDWHVQAIVNGAVRARSEFQSFKITNCAAEQPHADAAILLANVPKERPRLFFLASDLENVRSSLTSTRSEAFEALRSCFKIIVSPEQK